MTFDEWKKEAGEQNKMILGLRDQKNVWDGEAQNDDSGRIDEKESENTHQILHLDRGAVRGSDDSSWDASEAPVNKMGEQNRA